MEKKQFNETAVEELAGSEKNVDGKKVGTKNNKSPDAWIRKEDILEIIDELNSQLDEVSTLKNALQFDCENIKSELNKKNKVIDSLNIQINEMKSRIPIVKNLQDEIQFLNNELRSNKEKIEKLEDELKEKDQKIKEFQSKLIYAEEEKSEVFKKMMAELENVKQLQGDIINIKSERDKSIEQIKILGYEIERLRQSQNALNEIHEVLSIKRKARAVEHKPEEK